MDIWHIRLFGSLRVSRGEEEFFRFSTRKTGTLLAFLAFHADQRHTREVLCDLLWPDDPPQTSRARLRVALTSLRHQLEPPGVSSGSVIRSQGHEQVQLVTGAVATDVAEVERALRVLSDPSGSPRDAQVAAGQRIVSFFPEPLLTGFYDDWVITE
ncbi:MAG: winged helix-turn-helix domain-containing protein, partial [Fibrella sp.]|nr:winged helix-turn-helix domain-containing protein [Armatimonadota bacterium]